MSENFEDMLENYDEEQKYVCDECGKEYLDDDDLPSILELGLCKKCYDELLNAKCPDHPDVEYPSWR